MIKKYKYSPFICQVLLFIGGILTTVFAVGQARIKENFNGNWKFHLGDLRGAEQATFDDTAWRNLKLPHDWSIELPFDSTSPTGVGGGALRGGIGWYRKHFVLPSTRQGKHFFIEFDGVYRNSEVWLNGHLLGKRPNGYISFQYDITPWLRFGAQPNVLVVKADNAQQPNSRWYSGSGIYRNVWLVSAGDLIIDHWGTFISTPIVNTNQAVVNLQIKIRNLGKSPATASSSTVIYDAAGKEVARSASVNINVDSTGSRELQMKLLRPVLWSVDRPYLYTAVTSVQKGKQVTDTYETSFGIRYFNFDVNTGFSLNGRQMKILGVCNHHDLGCLGTAVNSNAIERQLRILKTMGCNAIRTSHNPPAPELLEICDRMGFIVMDEAFDMWKKSKNPFDYHLDWDAWHVKDLEDQVKRDRNHPSVFMWSVGNEVNEQWNANDSLGTVICRELVRIVKNLDTTRLTVSALSNPKPFNPLVKAQALDLIGFNYEHKLYASFHDSFPGQKFLGSETVSALETRGQYDLLPSDSIRRWPKRWDEVFKGGTPLQTVSAYDNVSAPWGSTHEETWKLIKKTPYLSGEFIWTGFDYIGEPTPYQWPSRSSYFGIIDLAGFPKDVYYMYQSEWTSQPVLHILPHWNWKPGNTVDVWAYYNNADEVELFLNGRSLGTRKKTGDDLHVMWRVPYEPGTLTAVSRKAGKMVLTKEVHTAGKAARILLSADRKSILATGEELSFITATIVDSDGYVVPDASNLLDFSVTGPADLVATDNGLQTSLESFQAKQHHAFNGLCLAVVRSRETAGTATIRVTADQLKAASLSLELTRK